MRAIIINHNTRFSTCLSLLSALKYADCPVTVIDCESTDGSFEFFNALKSMHRFELTQMPLQTHGRTLNKIFSETDERSLLLIDSDLEILNDNLVSFMKEELKKDNVYGAGHFMKGGMCKPSDLGAGRWLGSLYYPRPFIPFVAFNTAPIKEALRAGVSFEFKIVNNDLSLLPKTFYWTLKKIVKKGFRKKVLGHRPSRIMYDTGALIDVYLKQRGYIYSVMEDSRVGYVHYHGMTRRLLDPDDDAVGSDIKEGFAEKKVLERIKLYSAEIS